MTTSTRSASPAARFSRFSPHHAFRTSLTLALLAFLLPLAGPVMADVVGGPTPIGTPPSAVEGLVTAVTGSIVELFGGAIRVDVSAARIVSSSADAAGTPSPIITVGCRIGAQVKVGDAQITIVPPPPLEATFVVVTPPGSGSLTGLIQSVSVPNKSFTMLFLTVHTDGNTRFSGESDKGPITSLADLAQGQFAVVQFVATGGGLLALRVEAHGGHTPPPPPSVVTFRGVVGEIATDHWKVGDKNVIVNPSTKIIGSPKVGDTVEVTATVDSAGLLTALTITNFYTPPPLVTFRGVVQTIGAALWQIDGKSVNVNGETRIVGDPGVGDTVDVVAKSDSSTAIATLTALSIIKVSTPPPPPTPTEFDGIVQSISSPAAGSLAVMMGHWKISDRDVLVTGLTRITGDPKVGDKVHVKGYIMPGVAATVAGQFVATNIDKLPK